MRQRFRLNRRPGPRVVTSVILLLVGLAAGACGEPKPSADPPDAASSAHQGPPRRPCRVPTPEVMMEFK
jgi:hypothetical protein